MSIHIAIFARYIADIKLSKTAILIQIMLNSEQAAIPRVGFHPPLDYALDLEVMSAIEWLERVPAKHVTHPSRLEFYQLVLVTHGRFAHMVDFNLFTTLKGSLLAMRPGQVQRFVANNSWDGWVVLFRPETLPHTEHFGTRVSAAMVDDLPVQLTLNPSSFEASRQTLAQMQQDTALADHALQVNALVQAQLQGLMIRLKRAVAQPTGTRSDAIHNRHFKRYRDATEQHLHEWHQTSTYAKALGLSEKTLNRATHAITALSAKAYLSQRIALEAKRLLAHTPWPIAQVADRLGFAEPSNFIKFFQREVGGSPGAFKKKQCGIAKLTTTTLLPKK